MVANDSPPPPSGSVRNDGSYKEKVAVLLPRAVRGRMVLRTVPHGASPALSPFHPLKVVRSRRGLDRCQTRHNLVTTSKYTACNFLPKFLFEQLHPFHKFANFYFFVVCILQAIPSISITGRAPHSGAVHVCTLRRGAQPDRRRYSAPSRRQRYDSTPTQILKIPGRRKRPRQVCPVYLA